MTALKLILPKGLFTLLLVFAIPLSTYAADVRWDGHTANGGDGTSWDDPDNWNTNTIPGAGDVVIFPTGSLGGSNITIIGTAPNPILELKLFPSSHITFDLDITVSNTGSSSIVLISNNSILTIKSGRTFNASTTVGGVIDLQKLNSIFTVESGAIANLTGPTGIISQSDASTATINNSGVINFFTTSNAIIPNAASNLTINNNKCAVINLGNHATGSKIVFNGAASIVNNGLITYDSPNAGSAILNASPATATNNGFFIYTNGGGAAFGDGTATTDNGVDLSTGLTLDDTDDDCLLDLTTATSNMETYAWSYLGAASFSSNSAEGALNITSANFPNAAGPNTINVSDAACMTNGFSTTVEITNACAAALPVNLLFFNAHKEGRKVILKWSAATEINNEYFTVEKSTDGRDFTAVGKVAGAGNSLDVIEYDFMDEKPVMGKNYYRLKQTDFDGAYTYFNVQTIDFKGEENVSVYPNPVTDHLTIATSHEGAISVQVFNLVGQSILLSNKRAIDLSNLAKGSYFLQIRDEVSERILFQDKLIKR